MTHHLRIDTFSKNETANYEVGKSNGLMNLDAGNFVRKGRTALIPTRKQQKYLFFLIFLSTNNKTGRTGDWKNHISPELKKRVDEWIAQNLDGSDLEFVTELDKQD